MALLMDMDGLEEEEANGAIRQPSSFSEDGEESESQASRSPLRRVQFRSSATLIDDFTPYGNIYGIHPATFDFDSRGYMVQPLDLRTELEHLLNVDLGFLLECSAPGGVAYSRRPSSQEYCEDLKALEEGDQVEVLERRGNWIRDSAGWLPLVTNKKPLFSIRCL